MDKDELKTKFERIYKISKRINLGKINQVYESVKTKQRDKKEPSRIADISSETGLGKNSVWNYLKYLIDTKYLKKKGNYTPPFLRMIDRDNETIKFIYGKDKRDNTIEEETNKIISLFNSQNIHLSKDLEVDFNYIKQIKEYGSTFLKSYNKIINFIWENYNLKDFFKLEIGSGANKYILF